MAGTIKDETNTVTTPTKPETEPKEYNSKFKQYITTSKKIITKYGTFIGPGIMISVSYIDPGNYSAGCSAGSSNQYSLLFVVLLANLFAIFLQSLCIKLGTVTGYDLARSCREYLPKKLNWILWILAECAIIATDLAEVIGTAIALNILLRIPLPAGVVITIVDVLLILIAYRADTASIKFVKIFEYVVGILVLVVVICFAIMLSRIDGDARTILRGYAPSSQMFDGNGMSLAAGLLGATVMIHSIYLATNITIPRLREFDVKNGLISLDKIHSIDSKRDNYELEADFFYKNYKPSSKAIHYSFKYSIIEMVITLFTVALFVNSAILIVAGSTLYNTPEAQDADLYTLHDLLSKTIAPAMGTVFMVALLFSGQSAGIVCTIAGQVVSEGHINWTVKPWLRRLITRSISIIPCLIIASCLGREGLSIALNISQVIISILLPPLTAPLIYFTCCNKYMTIEIIDKNNEKFDYEDEKTGKRYKRMANNWLTSIAAIIIWVFISILNVYAIYDMAKNGV
ncbi:unnamed protein product [Candida verbasci]|uniref:Manganese transporter SMF1 n=1 Tax=Candida verbasci TaxID=1227364 RepID=A0A9W4XDB1_9ASCO|nr:unnamed protein product [Candida verbasci]